MPDPGALAVIYGGPSAEHEISCISARRIVETALDGGWNVTAVGLTHDRKWIDARAALVDVAAGDALTSPDELYERFPLSALEPSRRRHPVGRGRLPGAARTLRRGRRDPGAPRGHRRSLCRCGSPVVRPSAWTKASPSRSCTTTGSPLPPGASSSRAAWGVEVMEEAVDALGAATLRQAGQPRLVHRSGQGGRSRRARRLPSSRPSSSMIT